MGRKAFVSGYAVVLFDWQAHGKTAALSPTLTSDGLYEGEDFVRIASQAKVTGCPAPFWFTGYSLSGQLALWGVKAAQDLIPSQQVRGLEEAEIAGAAVICPNLDSVRSLSYLVTHPLGKYLEKAIAKELKKLALQLHNLHPESIDLAAVERANTIWNFDRELVIHSLGFPTVEAYYQASSPLLPCPSASLPSALPRKHKLWLQEKLTPLNLLMGCHQFPSSRGGRDRNTALTDPH